MRDPNTVARELEYTLRSMNNLKDKAEKIGVDKLTPKQMADFNRSGTQLIQRREELWSELADIAVSIKNGNPENITKETWDGILELLAPYMDVDVREDAE